MLTMPCSSSWMAARLCIAGKYTENTCSKMGDDLEGQLPSELWCYKLFQDGPPEVSFRGPVLRERQPEAPGQRSGRKGCCSIRFLRLCRWRGGDYRSLRRHAKTDEGKQPREDKQRHAKNKRRRCRSSTRHRSASSKDTRVRERRHTDELKHAKTSAEQTREDTRRLAKTPEDERRGVKTREDTRRCVKTSADMR